MKSVALFLPPEGYWFASGRWRGSGVLLAGCWNTGNCNSRFLYCAPHDEAVRRFGRNDDFGGWCERNKQPHEQQQIPFGHDNQKGMARANAEDAMLVGKPALLRDP
jgi:hypothetical protein